MDPIKSAVSLIATILLLGAAAVAGAPAASAVALSDLEYDSCTVNSGPGECSFECVPGLAVHVELTSGSGSISASCSTTPVADCSGGGCTGSGRYTGTSDDGACRVTGTGPGTCWVGEKAPKLKL